MVVTADGTVRLYSDLQGDFIPFTLGHVSQTADVKHAALTNGREPNNMASGHVGFGRPDSSRYWATTS